MAVNHYELYRKSTLGTTLTDSLDELVRDHELTPQLAVKVLQTFDKSIAETFRTQVKSKNTFKVPVIPMRLLCRSCSILSFFTSFLLVFFSILCYLKEFT